MVPKNFDLIYSKDQIADKVRTLGREISVWANDVWERSHSDVLAVPVLRGGIFFYADLVKEITTSIEIAPVRTWAYSRKENATSFSEISVRLDDVAAEGRSVVLIDDICDSGRTLAALEKAFKEAGALEVRSAVLIRRIIEEQEYNPEWVGFAHEGPEWFGGYGMKDRNRWGNLPQIYIVRQIGE